MLRLFKNRSVWLGILIVAGLLAVSLWPQTVAVDVATVSRGPLVVTIDEEGETRVHHRFVVSAPVAGRILRIELRPGDRVVKGETIVARMLADPPSLLDQRSRAEAEAAVKAAQSSLGSARAEARRAETAQALAASELERERELDRAGLTTRQSLDARVAEARAADEALRAAEFTVAGATAELARARARLMPPTASERERELSITAPVTGVVLRRLRESEAVVPAGEPLVELADPTELEIVTDLLSTDAVRVRPGMRASIEQFGGEQPLAARVRLVEPAGFTKISALGVEEQRVNVILDFDDLAAASRELGDAFRVEARIVVWEAESVVKVPTGALFRTGTEWAAYVVEGARAREAAVEIGQRTPQEAEVLTGLSEGQIVVLHPADTLTDGVRVEIRSTR
jgi:HlyD family secretion protein